MKLTEFRKLCYDEWDQQPHGDVTSLSLTDGSYDELQRDISAEAAWPSFVRLTPGEAEVLRNGGGVPRYRNPVTRSVIGIAGGAASDTATVHFGPHFPDRTVEITSPAAIAMPEVPRSPAHELERRFAYHPPKPGQPEMYKCIRAQALEFARLIDSACPDSREKSLAITHLEETVMWANASIARNG